MYFCDVSHLSLEQNFYQFSTVDSCVIQKCHSIIYSSSYKHLEHPKYPLKSLMHLTKDRAGNNTSNRN